MVTFQIVVFCIVIPCSLVGGCLHFTETYSLCSQVQSEYYEDAIRICRQAGRKWSLRSWGEDGVLKIEAGCFSKNVGIHLKYNMVSQKEGDHSMNVYMFLRHVFAPSQVICLEGFLVAMKNITLTSDRNSTSAAITEGSIRVKALMWIVGLIATELVSVLLVSWNWSITCRLACVHIVTCLLGNATLISEFRI
jgi:hypothetical protein